jgi:uncharacterized protein (TIGR02145 family)
MYADVSGQSSANIIKDRDGNVYSIKLFPDGKTWMTANLNIKIPESYCYENGEPNCKQYGRLYTWKAAQEGCRLLGNGWRLPTNDEWQQMVKWFGGVRDNSKDSGRAAYKALLSGGNAAFNAVFGGNRDNDGKFFRLEAHGFYWTATATDTAHACFYNFGKGGGMLNRHQDGEKYRAMSVRCVRD